MHGICGETLQRSPHGKTNGTSGVACLNERDDNPERGTKDKEFMKEGDERTVADDEGVWDA